MEELDQARLRAVELFRRERLEEPLEEYLEVFDEYQGIVEDLLEATVDLTTLEDSALQVLTDDKLFLALRYLAGPPISLDDLQTLSEITRTTPSHLRAHPDLAMRIIETVRLGLDRRRFPWVVEEREPNEGERAAAVLASAALLATQRVATKRRSSGKEAQEQRVRGALGGAGLQEIPSRTHLASIGDAPPNGQFCMEAKFGSRKADMVVGLWDGRKLPLECKVSNSEINSIKRLNNDAAAKAQTWLHDFGTLQVVPAAVLSGVYKLRHLQDAQVRGLTIFWAHDLEALTSWIELTRQGQSTLPGRGA